MSASGFALLLAFALVKVALGLALIYLGLRGSGRREPDEPVRGVAPSIPPRLPTRRARRPDRGGPRATPAPRRARV
jgi:hypothetical protein